MRPSGDGSGQRPGPQPGDPGGSGGGPGYRRAFRHDRARDAVDEELAHHIGLVVEELVAEGWPEATAREEAVRRFGDLETTRRYCAATQARRARTLDRGRSVDQLAYDLRLALRALRRSPGYAALVVLTLAFGIAANTAIFSVMNPYLFRPLPFGEPEGLAHITQVDPINGHDMARFSLPMFADWRERSRAFESLGAYVYGGVNVTGPEGPEAVNATWMSADMFDILRADAALGRTFLPEEGGPGGRDVVVLDHGLWERRYAGDPAVIGRVIALDGVPHTVVGVMPPSFVFPFGGVKLWIPVRDDPAAASRARTSYLLVGRLADGWTRDRAAVELSGIQQELARAHPDEDGSFAGVTVLPMRQALNFVWEILQTSFAVLLGAVAFVLAIACVNVASLTLARGASRVREISVRAALGASRRQVVRQLLTESVVLALLGGVLGVALAWMAVSAVGPSIPEDLYRVGDIDIDRTVLAYSLLVTLVTPVLFGLVPALQVTRRNLVDGLKEGAKSSGGLGAARGRRALVAVQVALAVVLITGAGLMVRSLKGVQGVDVGFDADRLLVVLVQPPEADYAAEEVLAFVERAQARLAAVPGVEAASASSWVPLNHEIPSWQFATPGAAGTPGDEWPTAIANRTHPGYFEAMGIPLLAGRDFGPSDDRSAAPVVIVNRSLAERHFPGGDPVGRTLLMGDPDDPTPVTVVGVVGDVRHADLAGQGGRAQAYRPSLQATPRRHFLLVRTGQEPLQAAAGVRAAMAELDPDLPFTLRPMTDIVRENTLQWALGGVFLTAFGLGALLLATLGIYGLVAFSASQRKRELGVRIAMGASRGDIRRTVVGDGLRLTALGLAVGMALAVLLARAASGALYGVTAFDPLTLGAVALVFAAVAGVASLLPALRAARTDPVTVLREE